MNTAILLSGGMDSIAIAYWLHPDIAFTIDYGQVSAKGEIRAAKTISEELNIDHKIITVDCSELGSGDLVGKPQISSAAVSEWWAFRNQLLLTLVGMKAISMNVDCLLFGSVKGDSIHKDGHLDFFKLINKVFKFQEGNINVKVPAINLTTEELIKKSKIPHSLLAWAHSCHTSEYACGSCRGCFKYLEVMKNLGYETY